MKDKRLVGIPANDADYLASVKAVADKLGKDKIKRMLSFNMGFRYQLLITFFKMKRM